MWKLTFIYRVNNIARELKLPINPMLNQHYFNYHYFNYLGMLTFKKFSGSIITLFLPLEHLWIIIFTLSLPNLLTFVKRSRLHSRWYLNKMKKKRWPAAF